MADGSFRFQQGAGQHYYQQFNQQHSRHHPQPRPSSPLNARITFNPDTPSPSRSPGPHSPSSHAYNMYAQNHATTQHLMNGASHQRFGMQINMVKPFQHQTHQHHGQHHAQHQDTSNHASHAGNFPHHQHTHSGGGLSNTGTHYSGHLQNGTPNASYTTTAKPPSDHWAQQLQLASQEREWQIAHPRARNAQGLSKMSLVSTASMLSMGDENQERQRPITDDTASKPKDQTWMELDMGGNTLRVMAPSLFDYTFLTKLYFNNNKLSYLPTEIGKLRNIKTLDLSINELRELPPQIGMLVNLKELLLFDNQLETLPFEVGNLYQCAMLGVEGNPLNDEYKSIVMEHGSIELIKFLRENAPVPDPPNERDWIVIDDTPVPENDVFSVLTYNTLCQHYCTSSLYGYTPSAALSWEHRQDVILGELRARNADFMCLQEVEHDAFENFFRANLAHDDYKGVFWPKGRAKTMSPNEAKTVDGCATFYKNSKYILLDKQLVDIPSAAINRPDMKGEPDIYNRVMPKDNIAVVTFFENRMNGTRVIVVNVHLHWDHAYKDVKVVQVAILLEQIAKFAETYASWPPLKAKEKQLYRYTNGDKLEGEDSEEDAPQPQPSKSYSDPLSIPFIISGDFNSLPNSGPYELLSCGTLPPDHPDLAGRKYGNFTRDGMQHPFALKSALGQINELPFTNYTANFTGVVDYIWYSTGNLGVRGLLGEVDEEYLERVPGFPNVHFPSDHLALFAEFQLKSRRATAKGRDKDRDGKS